MNIYLSHSTTFTPAEAQGILKRAEQLQPKTRWIKKHIGFAKYAERQAVVYWNYNVCWILRPEEARDWGDTNPPLTGSRYDAYKLKEIDLQFAYHSEWHAYLPEKISTSHLLECRAYWAAKAHAKALREARNARRRAAYAKAKCSHSK